MKQLQKLFCKPANIVTVYDNCNMLQEVDATSHYACPYCTLQYNYSFWECIDKYAVHFGCNLN